MADLGLQPGGHLHRDSAAWEVDGRLALADVWCPPGAEVSRVLVHYPLVEVYAA